LTQPPPLLLLLHAVLQTRRTLQLQQMLQLLMTAVSHLLALILQRQRQRQRQQLQMLLQLR
jgi:hypothetical protein